MRDLCFICNTPSASRASSVLHPPIESATHCGHSSLRKADVHQLRAFRRGFLTSRRTTLHASVQAHASDLRSRFLGAPLLCFVSNREVTLWSWLDFRVRPCPPASAT